MSGKGLSWGGGTNSPGVCVPSRGWWQHRTLGRRAVGCQRSCPLPRLVAGQRGDVGHPKRCGAPECSVGHPNTAWAPKAVWSTRMRHGAAEGSVGRRGAPACGSTPVLKPVWSKLFTRLGWGRQPRGQRGAAGSPGVGMRGCPAPTGVGVQPPPAQGWGAGCGGAPGVQQGPWSPLADGDPGADTSPRQPRSWWGGLAGGH